MRVEARDLEANMTATPIGRLINRGTYQQDMENRRLEIEMLAQRRIFQNLAIFATCCCFVSYLGLFLTIARMVMY